MNKLWPSAFSFYLPRSFFLGVGEEVGGWGGISFCTRINKSKLRVRATCYTHLQVRARVTPPLKLHLRDERPVLGGKGKK